MTFSKDDRYSYSVDDLARHYETRLDVALAEAIARHGPALQQPDVESADVRDCRALEAILPRAKSSKEWRALASMIEARGGRPVLACWCGRPVCDEGRELWVCDECL